MNIASLIGTLFLALASTSASALQPSPVSEPGTLELLAIGAVAAIVLAISKPRK